MIQSESESPQVILINQLEDLKDNVSNRICAAVSNLQSEFEKS